MVTMHPVESHNIHSVGHDPETRELLVRFRRKDGAGALYAYTPPDGMAFDEHVAGIRDAESPTAYFSDHIKNNDAIPYRKVDSGLPDAEQE